MKHTNTDQQKNNFFLHLFGFGSILHILLNFIFPFNSAVFAPAFGVIIYSSLYLIKKHISATGLMSLLLFSMNIYIFIFNMESLSSFAFVYFVIPLISAALANEFRPMLVLIVATLIEITVLVTFFGQLDRTPAPHYDLLSISTFLLIVFTLTFLHTLYFSRLWEQLQNKNKSMEKALISREGYLQLFFETAKDAIAVFDKKNRVIAVNPAFEKLYGFSAKDSYGKTIKPYPPEKEELAELQALELLKGKSFTILDTVDMKKDGTKFHAHITLSPIFDSNGEVIATSVISRDISYQRESEQLLLQSEKLKLAGEIAAGVAHEIRNPMTVISGFVQIMQQDPKHPYPEYTQLIHSELERINMIISEFLVLAKPQAPVIKNFSLKKLVDSSILLYSSAFNLKGIVFKDEWNGDPDFIISGEENSLKQVFINLLKNAIEAIDSGGTITLSVTSGNNNMVCIKIADNGMGMSPETLQRIFEPFYTTKEGGTGLGLLISQKIVQDHGGSLKLESTPEKGTAAQIILPYRKTVAEGGL